MPVGAGIGPDERPADLSCPVHEPHRGLAVVVLPEEIAAGVLVEISVSQQVPGGSRIGPDRSRADLSCIVKQPHRSLTVGVLPEEVGFAVAVEIERQPLILDGKAADWRSAAEKASDQCGGTVDEVDSVQADRTADRQQSHSETGCEAVVRRRIYTRRNVEAVQNREVEAGEADGGLCSRVAVLDHQLVADGIQRVQRRDARDRLVVGVGGPGDRSANYVRVIAGQCAVVRVDTEVFAARRRYSNSIDCRIEVKAITASREIEECCN